MAPVLHPRRGGHVGRLDRRVRTPQLGRTSPHLEALAWPRPETVQVPIGGEDDDCFGLWMMYGGRLVEVPLPHTLRHQDGYDFTGWLTRTDGSPAEG
ncbi:hypothetical protein ACFQ0Q_27105 [Streptomyces aureus]